MPIRPSSEPLAELEAWLAPVRRTGTNLPVSLQVVDPGGFTTGLVREYDQRAAPAANAHEATAAQRPGRQAHLD